MREAVGNTFLVGCALTFMTIFTLFLVGSSAYSRAFNVKNLVIDTIELNNGKYTDQVRTDVDETLAKIGYRLRNNFQCPQPKKSNEKLVSKKSDFDYCVYRITEKDSNGVYYRAVAFISIDLPFLNRIRIPVSGETSIVRT